MGIVNGHKSRMRQRTEGGRRCASPSAPIMQQFSLETKTVLQTSARWIGLQEGCRSDDPEFAMEAPGLQAVGVKGIADRGIMICGQRRGRFPSPQIRFRRFGRGAGTSTYSARQGVEHDRMNVLFMGGRVIGEAVAHELVRAFRKAKFIT